MPSLVEIQRSVRDAIVSGDLTSVAGLVVGGGDPLKRLEIHQRHYESSLVTAVNGKFPATAWLVGAEFLMAAAREFVHHCPPKAPCIAEYGGDFPAWLSRQPAAERLPYLRSFAELEWTIGLASIAIEQPALDPATLAGLEEQILPDVVLDIQPGVWCLGADWPVDDLLKLYLTNSAPGEFVFEPAATWFQIRGARGTFDVKRLDAGDFAFRTAILDGRTIGEAAERALDALSDFDPGRGLAALLAERLVTAARIGRVEQPL